MARARSTCGFLAGLPIVAYLLLLRIHVAGAGDFRCGPFCSSRRGPTPTCSVQCAGATCNPIQGNINGNVMFLDVSGDVYPRDGDSAAVTPTGCCSVCKKTDGCNAWVVCNNPEGCGQGCNVFARQLGPFHSCSGTDAWPYQMCSLKRVSSTSAPPTFPGGAAQGWVSGTVRTKPAKGCPEDVTSATCSMCRSTKSFSRCIGCARKKRVVGMKPACGACATLSTAALRSACIQGYLTFGDQPLGGCSTSPDADGRIDVRKLEACITGISKSCRASKDPALCTSCIAKIGATSNCKDCASLATPGARRQCTACLSSQDQACAGCLPTLTGSLAVSASCFTCLATTTDPAAKPFCADCSNSNEPKTCLECVTGQAPYAAVPAYSRKGCYWFVSGQLKSSSPQFKPGIRCLQLAKNGRQADGCISCAIQLTGQGVLDCLQTISRLKTDLGKLNAYLCVGFDGGVNSKCVACMTKATSAKAVAKCSLA